MPHNISHMNLRDNGDLMWLSKIIVLIAGLIAKAFGTFLNSEVMMNECYLASSSSRIVLTALKEIIIEILLKSCMYDAFKGECKH